MTLRERFAEHPNLLNAILGIATCRASLLFADVCWDPFDHEAELARYIEGRDPGVIFETSVRVVVIEEHSGELRYYAGGWCAHESLIYLEQDRIHAEGSETGVFSTPRDAVLFSERFLVRGQALQDIEAPRMVHHRQETDSSRQAQSHP